MIVFIVMQSKNDFYKYTKNNHNPKSYTTKSHLLEILSRVEVHQDLQQLVFRQCLLPIIKRLF